MDGGKLEGLIFDLKKYAINDGPGIRTTVFFKGCPLSCRWCHNPEGQSSAPEIMVRPARCLADCSQCVSVCPEQAVTKPALAPVLDRPRCTVCGKCADVCPAQAIQVVGRRITASELLREIENDRIFQEESGGGVTFSGGEPLSQPDFLSEILDYCRKKEVHSTVDTCGFAPAEVLDTIAPKTDLFLYDLKLMDEKRHAAFTGVSNRPMLENLRRLSAAGHKTVVRIPVIPGVNDDEENIRLTAEFLRSLGTISDISLLPYHKLGREKYGGLDKESGGEEFSPPSEETLQLIKKALEGYGFRVSLGE
jgi:pyruvate formate lyase activating enzyme